MPQLLPQVYRFSYEDYSSLGSSFQKFISNLNLFTWPTYNLMNGGIGFSNLQRAIYSQKITAGSTTPLSFVNPLSINPSGVAVVQVLEQNNTPVALTSAVSAANWSYDGTNINILNITGLTAGNIYNISLEVF